MVFKKKGFKWFGVLLACCIMFGASFVLYLEDVSAITLSTSNVSFRYCSSIDCSTYYWSPNLTVPGANNPVGSSSYINNVGHVSTVRLMYDSFTATGNYATFHFETNIVRYDGGTGATIQWVNLPYIGVRSTGGYGNIESSSVSYVTTPWDNGHKNTLTVYVDLVVSGLTSGTTYSDFYINLGSYDYAFLDSYNSSHTYVWVEQNPTSVIFSNNSDDAYNNQVVAQNETMIQNQNTIINQNQTMIDNSSDYYDANYDAVDNISGQSTSDIPDSSMTAQTTSLINAIGRFFRTLSSYEATSCSLTLPFPSYAGGSTTVDPCSGKEIAPTIVQVASSLLLICTFVPLAFIVLRMIYNEIRSWTNG